MIGVHSCSDDGSVRAQPNRMIGAGCNSNDVRPILCVALTGEIGARGKHRSCFRPRDGVFISCGNHAGRKRIPRRLEPRALG
ncbi:hypothetical protein SDC9_164129 [bioreactor metagenome]|uniref:Uncharacterized protein n=1 Tax=bioreactor metagenome TaxID=1076179 RepID=A0A645FY08_9ZZZZ